MTAVLQPETTDKAGLLELAQQCADYIVARNPYIELIAVSGSLSRPEHEGDHEDVDFFVISREGSLWKSFMGCLLHGWRFARSHGYHRTFFCFNYLVSRDHPEEIDLRRDEYVREFLNLHVLHGLELYKSLLRRNEDRLREAESDQFDKTLMRVDEILVAATSHDKINQTVVSELMYQAGAIPFHWLAKLMEMRRRRRYSDVYIYSNRRVIRSHPRRAWQPEGVQSRPWPAASAFDSIAANYDEVVESPANQHMRDLVWMELSRLLRPGMRVLDLGAGNGVDAVRFAKAGASVLAIDVSPSMVTAARARVNDAGLSESVEVRVLAIEELTQLLPHLAHSFDLILSNFGALNLAANQKMWPSLIGRLLKPNGYFVSSVMNRWCLAELIGGVLRLRLGFAFRRLRAEPIKVGNVLLDTKLYSLSEFTRLLPAFASVKSRALCVFALPPSMEHSLPRLSGSRMLKWIDRILGRVRGLRSLGDHFLVVMKPQSSGRTLLQGRPPITASPVVVGLSKDGSNRIVIASDRLDLLDSDGHSLSGWPRKISKPVASTPAHSCEADGPRIFVGSDDHRLHSIKLDGKPSVGFPFPTGGDIFSSPVVGDLDGDGEDEVAFGSDDGGVYVVDVRGGLKPGWPQVTGGFVSASPAVATTDTGKALFLGSWDGSLYGFDPRGQAMPGWPQKLGYPIWSTAAIADLDGDGCAEIIVATHRLFAFRGNGQPLRGFPANLEGYAVGSPAVGDINADGEIEAVIASDRVYAFHGDASLLPHFPLDLGAYVWVSPLLVDIDGDGKPEIVIADMKGQVWAIDGSGRVLDGWPRKAGSRIVAAPTAADIDGDGYLELLVATWDGRLVVYQTDASACDEVASPWRSFPGRVSSREPILTGLPEVTSPDSESSPVGTLSPAPWPTRVRLEPHLPLPYRVTEIHLEVESSFQGVGMLYYEIGGRVHPSPLLRKDDHYFALVQPLPPLKRVRFRLELHGSSGKMWKIPEEGVYEMRIGKPGTNLAIP